MHPFDREPITGEPGEEVSQAVELSGVGSEVVSGELPGPLFGGGVVRSPAHHLGRCRGLARSLRRRRLVAAGGPSGAVPTDGCR